MFIILTVNIYIYVASLFNHLFPLWRRLFGGFIVISIVSAYSSLVWILVSCQSAAYLAQLQVCRFRLVCGFGSEINSIKLSSVAILSLHFNS